MRNRLRALVDRALPSTNAIVTQHKRQTGSAPHAVCAQDMCTCHSMRCYAQHSFCSRPTFEPTSPALLLGAENRPAGVPVLEPSHPHWGFPSSAGLGFPAIWLCSTLKAASEGHRRGNCSVERAWWGLALCPEVAAWAGVRPVTENAFGHSSIEGMSDLPLGSLKFGSLWNVKFCGATCSCAGDNIKINISMVNKDWQIRAAQAFCFHRVHPMFIWKQWKYLT